MVSFVALLMRVDGTEVVHLSPPAAHCVLLLIDGIAAPDEGSEDKKSDRPLILALQALTLQTENPVLVAVQ